MKAYPEKYEQLIDEETWAFIRRTDACYPPQTIDFTIARQREVYDALCGEFSIRHPASISTRDHFVAAPDYSVPVRHYSDSMRCGDARVVYFHGGGFVVGSLDSHDDICAEVCHASGLPVTAVDYRLSPEHAHPAAFNDAVVVVKSLAAESPLILCGDSAGGNLAAAVCHAVRGTEVSASLLGQVLIYPGLGGDMTHGSYITHCNAPLLTTQDVRFYSMIRTGGSIRNGDATLAPLHDNDFCGLPPTVVITAECDPLADDGQAYCQKILECGERALCVEEAGLVHGYLRARHTVASARHSFARIIAAIDMLQCKVWDSAVLARIPQEQMV